MTTEQIAKRLVELCGQGQFETAQKELFSTDATSTEPFAANGFEKEVKGQDAIIQKGHQFQSMVDEIYGIKISQPVVAINSFAISMDVDAKMKGQDRGTMSEVCVYQVKDGKIVAEQFFM